MGIFHLWKQSIYIKKRSSYQNGAYDGHKYRKKRGSDGERQVQVDVNVFSSWTHLCVKLALDYVPWFVIF